MKDKRSSHTVDTDRWDRADYARVRTEIAQIGAATESLAQITPTAQPEMFDIFQMFMKSRPEFLDLKDVRDDHRIDLAVNEQAEELPEFRDLRRFTRGDLVGAAMAAVKVEPEFETLFDREKFRQRQAEEIQRLREELLDKLAQLAGQAMQQPGEGGEGDLGDLQSEIDALRRAIAAAELALEEGLGADKDSISAQLARAMAGATDEARDNTENARAYGIEPGKLTRMPADERLKLAARLNTARLRKIAQLFGPLRNLAFAARQRVVPTLPHEMTGVTVGRDLERLLPGELLRFADPDQEDAFYVDYAESRLLTYKVRGKEKVGKGGIIVLEDGSGSMSGVRELQAKAIMLVMMNIAKKEHRTFHLIHFGSRGQTKRFSFTKPADFTLDRVVEAAEFFLSSGTDFQTPFSEGMEILKAEFARTGKVESDIVMISDGECTVTDDWLGKFHADLDHVKGTAWGILIGNDGGGYSSGTLKKICHGLVCNMTDLTNGGKEIRAIFQGVRRAN